MSGFYTAELRRLTEEHRAAGHVIGNGGPGLDPAYLDAYFWKIYAKAEAEARGAFGEELREGGRLWRAEAPRRYVRDVLTRHRVAAAEREARELRIAQLRLRIRSALTFERTTTP